MLGHTEFTISLKIFFVDEMSCIIYSSENSLAPPSPLLPSTPLSPSSPSPLPSSPLPLPCSLIPFTEKSTLSAFPPVSTLLLSTEFTSMYIWNKLLFCAFLGFPIQNLSAKEIWRSKRKRKKWKEESTFICLDISNLYYSTNCNHVSRNTSIN